VDVTITLQSAERDSLFWYSAYGLRLCADRPVPGLLPSQQVSDVDVTITLQSTPATLKDDLTAAEVHWRSSVDGECGEPVLQIKQTADAAYVSFLYSDQCEFILDAKGTRVWASWPDELSMEDVFPWLRGPILGAVLRLRNTVSLHASAVSIGGSAIAVLGPAGSGKSTTAAAFARRGYGVLSDDVVALKPRNDSFWVQPGYPNVLLWPESVRALYGSEDALPRITPDWEKCYLDLLESGFEFIREPLPLAAIYVLCKRSTDTHTQLIQPVSGKAALMELISNTYVSYLTDRSMRSRDFELLGWVAAHVPIRRVTPHSDPAQLSRMCDRIREDAETLIASFVA
jgi:hypothetical protein